MQMQTVTFCSYVLDLEARVNAYEKDQSHEASRTCPPQRLDIEANTIPQPSHSSQLPSPSSGSDADDLDDNPHTEDMAQLVKSPEGQRRRPLFLFSKTATHFYCRLPGRIFYIKSWAEIS